MSIKYFFQNGPRLEYDRENPFIKALNPNTETLSNSQIYDLLREDRVSVKSIEGVKYWSSSLKGWVELSERENLNNDGKEILLLIQTNEGNDNSKLDNFSKNLSPLKKENEVIQNISILERRIIDLENKIDCFNHNQFAAIDPLQLKRNNLLFTEKNNFIKLENTGISNLNSNLNDSSRLDFAFLYSNPLVKQDPKLKEKTAAGDPVDYETEISNLVNIFKDTGKKIKATFEVATMESITKLFLIKRPKVLHISCHGSYDEKNNFYLKFEDKNGNLLKFGSDQLNSILNDPLLVKEDSSKSLASDFQNDLTKQSSKLTKSPIDLIVISACHSQPMADIFSSVGVPAVISVHRDTKILDEAAIQFSSTFYSSLFEGRTVKSSFNHALKIVSVSIDNDRSVEGCCCCNHNHKDGCNWIKLKKKEESYAHLMHLKHCTCREKESHVHTRTCTWAQIFMKILDIKLESTNGNNKTMKVCCCSPEIAHDESSKFILEQNPDFKNESLFTNLPLGNLFIKNRNFCLNLNSIRLNKAGLVGRNVDAFKVISVLRDDKNLKNRLLTVYGKNGIGKNSFVKLVAKYMFERNYCEDGVVYINCKGHLMSDMWFIDKILTNLGLSSYMNSNIEDINQFCNIFNKFRILIVTNFSSQKEESVTKIKELINCILNETSQVKFLISYNQPLELEKYEYKYQLSPVSKKDLAKILYQNSAEFLPENLRNNFKELEQDPILDLCEGNLSRLLKISFLLRESENYDYVIKIMKKENLQKDELIEELIKMKMDSLDHCSNSQNGSPTNSEKIKINLIYQIIFALSILPQGICENEIKYIFKEDAFQTFQILADKYIILNQTHKDKEQTFFILNSDLDFNTNNFINGISLGEESKQSIYRNLILYYANLFRDIVCTLYKKNEVFIQFQADRLYCHEIWVTLTKGNKNPSVYNPTLQTRFDFHEINLISLLQVKNPFMSKLILNGDKEFIDSITTIALCSLTIMKMNRKTMECLNYFDLFHEICVNFNLTETLGWLLLYKANFYALLQLNKQSRGNTVNLNYSKIFSSLTEAEEIFNSFTNNEGQTEVCFMRSLIRFILETDTNNKISSDSYKKCVNDIQNSISIYTKNENKLSLARLYLFYGELLLSNNVENESTMFLINESLNLFMSFKKPFPLLIIKCHILLSKYYLVIKKISNCLHHTQEARNYQKKINLTGNPNQISLMNAIKNQIDVILNELNDPIAKSENVIVFLKGNQLIRKNKNELYDTLIPSLSSQSIVKPILNYKGITNDLLKEKLNNYDKELVMKYESLTEENLKEILNKKGKVLCIITDDYENGNLVLEDEYGAGYSISTTELRNLLETSCSSSKINYELIILAFPQSVSIANVFLEFDVTNVICFQFNEEFLNQSKNLYNVSFPQIFNDFVMTLLHYLLLDKFLEESFELSKKEFNSHIVTLRERLYYFNLRKESNNISASSGYLGEVKLLSPSAKEKTFLGSQKIFSNFSNKAYNLNLKEKVFDNSKKLGVCYSIKNQKKNSIGRKIYKYNGNINIKNFNIVNLYGESGIGKTSFIKDLCVQYPLRSFFLNGLFYFDLFTKDSIDQINILFIESDLFNILDQGEKTNLKTLIILDNVDRILKYSDANLFFFLSSLDKNKNLIHFVLISKENHTQNNVYGLNIKSMNLNPFLELESFYFFMYHVERDIFIGEIDREKDDEEIPQNIIDIVKFSHKVKMCSGNASALKKLSEVASFKPLNKIQYTEFLTNKMIKKLKLDINDDFENKDELFFSIPVRKNIIPLAYLNSNDNTNMNVRDKNNIVIRPQIVDDKKHNSMGPALKNKIVKKETERKREISRYLETQNTSSDNDINFVKSIKLVDPGEFTGIIMKNQVFNEQTLIYANPDLESSVSKQSKKREIQRNLSNMFKKPFTSPTNKDNKKTSDLKIKENSTPFPQKFFNLDNKKQNAESDLKVNKQYLEFNYEYTNAKLFQSLDKNKKEITNIFRKSNINSNNLFIAKNKKKK